MTLPFFCPDNIYWPCLGKVRLGRPNQNQYSRSIFISEEEKNHSTQNCMHYNGVMPNFQFWFSFVFKKYEFSFIKNLSKFLTIYIIFFFKLAIIPLLWSLCWCQRNLFHLVAMDNECLMQFETLKSKVLGKWKTKYMLI